MMKKVFKILYIGTVDADFAYDRYTAKVQFDDDSIEFFKVYSSGPIKSFEYKNGGTVEHDVPSAIHEQITALLPEFKKELSGPEVTIRCEVCDGEGGDCASCGGNGYFYHHCNTVCVGYPNTDCRCSRALNPDL